MDIRQSLAQGGPLVLGATTYQLEPLTQGLKGLFTAWCVEEAWKRAIASSQNLPPQYQQKPLELCAAQVNSGQYEFYGPLALEVQKTLPGILHLLWLRLRPNHPTLTKEALEQDLVNNLAAVMLQIKALDADPTTTAQK